MQANQHKTSKSLIIHFYSIMALFTMKEEAKTIPHQITVEGSKREA